MEDRTRKRLLIVSLIVAGVLLFGCLEYLDNRLVTGIVKKKPANETNVTNATLPNETGIVKPKACEELTTGKDACIIERAYTNNNPADCAQLKNDSYKLCVYRIAERNYQYCSLLDNIPAIDACYLNVSAKVGDQACPPIVNTSVRQACLLTFVAESCRSITNESDRYVCDAIAKDAPELCKRSQLSDVCYLKFSRSKSDVCGNISNAGIKAACTGILANNLSACNALTGVVKDNCYKTFAVETSNYSLCGGIADSTYKDGCYSGCAIAAKNSSLCSMPSDEQKRDSCYNIYSQTLSEVTPCKEVRSLSLLKMCVQNVAIKTASPASCEAMLVPSRLSGTPTQAEVNTCYYAVIGQSNVSSAACLAINANGTDSKDQCIIASVRRTLDHTFCDSISDSSLKQACTNLR
jgi:hypothetical protein